NLGPFEVHRENVVAAARKNEHRRAAVLVGRRTIDTDRWLRHIAETHDWFPGDQWVRWLRRVALFADIALLPRRAAGPKFNDLDRFGGAAIKKGEHSEAHKADPRSRFHGPRETDLRFRVEAIH